jgi:putative aminopeptidase FrvX
MDKQSKKFLFDYLNNASPTGFEQAGQQIWLDYIKPYTNDSHGGCIWHGRGCNQSERANTKW